jgi:hypothetical protein
MPSLDPQNDAMGRWSCRRCGGRAWWRLRRDQSNAAERGHLPRPDGRHRQWSPGVQLPAAGRRRDQSSFSFVIHPLNVQLHPQAPSSSAGRSTCPTTWSRVGCGLHAADVRVAHHGRQVADDRAAHRGLSLHAGRDPAPDDAARRRASATSSSTRWRAWPSARARASSGWARSPAWWATPASPSAHESDIAITSGNSLTVAMTLEAAKQAVQLMGVKRPHPRARR